MKKILPLLLCMPLSIFSQVNINIDYAHHLTPLMDDLYLAGSFNNWLENDPSYKFTRVGFNQFELSFTPQENGNFEYKITRGTWDAVEANNNGGYVDNRSFDYSGSPLNITVQVPGWEDIGGVNQTAATDNTHILDLDFYIPQLNRNRRVWIYLPPDYHTAQKSYPVVYMQDGQNLFDASISPFGEWEVDESMNNLFYNQNDYGAIVVGIDHGDIDRLNEYSPWVNPSYGGGQGDEYMLFLKNNLKPLIDSMFRTYPQPEYTGIMGSSMGALIANYGAVEHQDAFGKVGILSPAFWFAEDDIFDHVDQTGVNSNMKFYFVSGTNESSSMVPLMNQMKNTLISNGLPEERSLLVTDPNGQHSEWFWAEEFPAAYVWLFGDLNFTVSNKIQTTDNIILHPNPSSNKVYLLNVENQDISEVSILDAYGRSITVDLIDRNNFDVSSLKAGVYFLNISFKSGSSLSKKFIISYQ